MKRKFLSMLLALAMVFTLLPTVALAADLTGTGTQADPYIVNQESLTALSTFFTNNASNPPTDTIYLKADGNISLPTGQHLTLPSGFTLDLDFNGYTLTKSDMATEAPIENHATLTVRDSSSEKTGGISGKNRCINNYATLSVFGGNYSTNSDNGGTAIRNATPDSQMTIYDCNVQASNFAVYNYGTMTVEGGTFVSTSCSHRTDYAYCFASEGTLYFKNGTIEGVHGALSITKGTGTVNGGTFKTVACANCGDSKAHYAIYVAGEEGAATATINGGTFTSVSKAAIHVGNDNTNGDGGINASATVVVKGGSFISKDGVNVMATGPSTGTPSIQGGTFSNNGVSRQGATETTIADYVPSSTHVVSDPGDGKYTVTARNETNSEAKIGDIYYDTLAHAIAAANSGDTVTLLGDVTINSEIVLNKAEVNNLTIDGAGHTITANNCVGFKVGKDYTSLEFKDLTLTGVLPSETQAGEGSTGPYMGIGTYNGCYGVGTLTLTNTTIDGFSYGLYFGKNPAATDGPYNENPISIKADSLTIQNCYIKGAYLEKLTDSTFTGCTFANNGKDVSKVQSSFQTWMCGIDLNLKNGTYQNIAFTNCKFTGNGANSGTALHIKARNDGKYGSDTRLTGVTISGCTFSGNNTAVGPVVFGEPDKSNPSPFNITIQKDVTFTNNVADVHVVTFESNGGTAVPTRIVANDTAVEAPTAPIKSGYTFGGWYTDEALTTAYDFDTPVTADLTLYAKWNVIYVDDGGSSSSSSSSSTKTETVKNPDGSTTTTVTDKKTGTVTEITTGKPVTDEGGNTTQTKTETVTNKDGSSTETVTETVKGADGSTSETQTVVSTDKDGATTTTETVKATDPTGTTATKTTETNAEGETTTSVEAAVSDKALTEAAKDEAPVTLPVEVAAPKAAEADSAPVVKVEVPSAVSTENTVKVEIPVENPTPGTVAIIVKEDGTEEIVKTSVLGENGVVLTLDGSATVKIVDNSKHFEDVHPVEHWAEGTIDFVASREIFSGTGENTFSPDVAMTRAMLMTVLARYDGEDTTTGDIWYEKGMDWAKANGVSDGTNPDANITREQLATMLYRYAGSPEHDGAIDRFPDADAVSSYAAEAMRWAVANGLIDGMDDGTLNPQGDATRAQVAAVLARFCSNQA